MTNYDMSGYASYTDFYTESNTSASYYVEERLDQRKQIKTKEISIIWDFLKEDLVKDRKNSLKSGIFLIILFLINNWINVFEITGLPKFINYIVLGAAIFQILCFIISFKFEEKN